jgi:hypothetical protein
MVSGVVVCPIELYARAVCCVVLCCVENDMGCSCTDGSAGVSPLGVAGRVVHVVRATPVVLDFPSYRTHSIAATSGLIGRCATPIWRCATPIGRCTIPDGRGSSESMTPTSVICVDCPGGIAVGCDGSCDCGCSSCCAGGSCWGCCWWCCGSCCGSCCGKIARRVRSRSAMRRTKLDLAVW